MVSLPVAPTVAPGQRISLSRRADLNPSRRLSFAPHQLVACAGAGLAYAGQHGSEAPSHAAVRRRPQSSQERNFEVAGDDAHFCRAVGGKAERGRGADPGSRQPVMPIVERTHVERRRANRSEPDNRSSHQRRLPDGAVALSLRCASLAFPLCVDRSQKHIGRGRIRCKGCVIPNKCACDFADIDQACPVRNTLVKPE